MAGSSRNIIKPLNLHNICESKISAWKTASKKTGSHNWHPVLILSKNFMKIRI